MDDNKIYNYLNQYDREVYIEGESEQQLDVINTVDFSNNTDNDIVKYTVISKTQETIELDIITKTDLYFPIEDIVIVDSENEINNGISIKVSTYDKNYSYMLILDDKRISIIDDIALCDDGSFILYFKNCYYSSSISLRKCEFITSSIGTKYADNNDNSIVVDSILYGVNKSTVRVKENGMNVRRLAYNKQCVSIANNTIINISSLPLDIAIIDYKKNNVHYKTNYDEWIYVSDNMFFVSVSSILELTTAEEDLYTYVTVNYPAVVWDRALLIIDGKLYPIGTRCPVKNNGKIRKIRLLDISNVEKEFSITAKTFKTNGVPSTFMINKYANELDIQTYTKSVNDDTSQINNSKLYLNNVIKNRRYSFNVELQDSDSNREVENILKNRYKIISRRCDSHVLW